MCKYFALMRCCSDNRRTLNLWDLMLRALCLGNWLHTRITCDICTWLKYICSVIRWVCTFNACVKLSVFKITNYCTQWRTSCNWFIRFWQRHRSWQNLTAVVCPPKVLYILDFFLCLRDINIFYFVKFFRH